MRLKSLVRDARLLIAVGAFALGIGANQTIHTAQAYAVLVPGQVQVADGSESTGKPPKPKPNLIAPGQAQVADGSESTSKPKPKLV